LEDSRGGQKVWVDGALCVRAGHELTRTARSRNTAGYLRLLTAGEEANPTGDLDRLTYNLSRHKSPPIQAWLDAPPRISPIFLPTGACWLNLPEGWWRGVPFGSRHEACAGQTFADGEEIDNITRLATHKLNQRAKPWNWGRPPRPQRHLRRRFVYCL
jgi:hypothetical protein